MDKNAASFYDTPALMAAAQEAAQKAYAPYSHFYVGAALLCADGAIVTGGNVENASYGLTICAERVAIVRALAEGKGKGDFKALALYAQTRSSGEPVLGVTPCGACRQVLSEFVQADFPVVCPASEAKNSAASYSVLTMGELLPQVFRLK